MKQIINDFINSIDTNIYSKIRASMGDSECRRYLKEHLQNQFTIPTVGDVVKLEVDAEICCDLCYEVIYNYIDCPVCKNDCAEID